MKSRVYVWSSMPVLIEIRASLDNESDCNLNRKPCFPFRVNIEFIPKKYYNNNCTLFCFSIDLKITYMIEYEWIYTK